MTTEPQHNTHSVSDLHYHLVLCVKYRVKIINDQISDELKNMFTRIGEPYNIKLEEWNHDIDHVHILMNTKPTTNLTKFINAYKSASSRLIKKQHPEIKNKLWHEQFWSRTYYIATTGGAPLNTIKKYIQGQGHQA